MAEPGEFGTAGRIGTASRIGTAERMGTTGRIWYTYVEPLTKLYLQSIPKVQCSKKKHFFGKAVFAVYAFNVCIEKRRNLLIVWPTNQFKVKP